MSFADSLSSPTARSARFHYASDLDRLTRALAGDAAELRALVADWTPTLQARIARVLVRRGGLAQRGAVVMHEDVRDLTQDVLCWLLADDARVLRGWSPDRGVSLRGFVGLVGERYASSVARRRRRSPLTERPTDVADIASTSVDDTSFARMERRDLARALAPRLLRELTPTGRAMFVALFVEEHEVDEVCARFSTTADAVYSWRVRIRRAAARIVGELDYRECIEAREA
jgi:DNA-directed RNA polymerase specialized sigma24 family protein